MRTGVRMTKGAIMSSLRSDARRLRAYRSRPRVSQVAIHFAHAIPSPSPACARPAQNEFIRGLFIAHSEALYGYIHRRVRNAADAAELVQEVYVRVMRRPAAAKLRAAPQPYLFQTASNLVRDRRRRNVARAADRHVQFADEIASPAHDSPEALLAASQLARVLEQAIGELQPRAREVLSLRLLEELSYREIENRTQIPMRSIERYMNHALRHCSRRVARQL